MVFAGKPFSSDGLTLCIVQILSGRSVADLAIVFYRFFHNPPCVQELRFGEPRTDQLQAGDRNAESMGSRNRHGEGRVAGEIHRDGVLDLKDVRVENAEPQVEQGKHRRCLLKSGKSNEIYLLQNAIERLLPRALPLYRTSIRGG